MSKIRHFFPDYEGLAVALSWVPLGFQLLYDYLFPLCCSAVPCDRTIGSVVLNYKQELQPWRVQYQMEQKIQQGRGHKHPCAGAAESCQFGKCWNTKGIRLFDTSLYGLALFHPRFLLY